MFYFKQVVLLLFRAYNLVINILNPNYIMTLPGIVINQTEYRVNYHLKNKIYNMLKCRL